MSPRPVDPPIPDVEPALALSRDGRHAEAFDWLSTRARAERDRSVWVTAAVGAFARIARAAADAGDAQIAERALDEALRLKPRYADLHLQLAQVMLTRQRKPEARRALRAALAIHPRYLAARVELALLDAGDGRIGEALSSLREVERDTHIGEPLAFQQGLKSLERADWDGASTLFRRAIGSGDPALSEALERHRALLHEGALERAAQVLRDVLPDHEGYPDLHAMLGGVELRLGQLDDALASLARALELNPDYHAARLMFARALDGLGQRAQALEQVQLVLQHDPEHGAARELIEQWSGRGRRHAAR
jgi:tetratricopeptide (TPR) repeat protein